MKRPARLLHKARRKHKAKDRRAPVGAPPGTIVASATDLPTRMNLIAYGETTEVERHNDCTIEQVLAARKRHPVLSLDIEGFANIALINDIASRYKLHELAIEDVVDLHQRPKAEAYSDHIYIVMRLPPGEGEHHGGDGEAGEQISMFLGKDYVITFQEREGDCFEPVRQRIGAGRRLVSSGPDYLAYALLDACVDAYFPMLEQLGERVELMEDKVFSNPDPRQVNQIHEMKRELLHVRRAAWPMRELLNSLIRDEHHAISKDTRVYLRDVYDHTIQLMDILETYREIASGLLESYLSSQSARMNEVMAFLTVIATIFMPLSFLAGLWGMNFDISASPWNMPELKWYFGYPMALGVMAATATGMLIYFRYRRWL